MLGIDLVELVLTRDAPDDAFLIGCSSVELARCGLEFAEVECVAFGRVCGDVRVVRGPAVGRWARCVAVLHIRLDGAHVLVPHSSVLHSSHSFRLLFLSPGFLRTDDFAFETFVVLRAIIYLHSVISVQFVANDVSVPGDGARRGENEVM